MIRAVVVDDETSMRQEVTSRLTSAFLKEVAVVAEEGATALRLFTRTFISSSTKEMRK